MEIVVLRKSAHGIPTTEYVSELQTRLPEHTVRFADTPERERTFAESADVITGITIDETVVERAEQLELFACVYAGTGHLPREALSEQGAVITSAAGVHTSNAAEHAIGAILTFARRFHEAVRSDSWQPISPSELADSTVTIVGLGAIGGGIARRLEPFDARTIGVRRRPEDGGPADEVIGADELHDALAETDFLVLACPLTDATHGLISEEELVTLPPDAVVVNIARGPVVDTTALLKALQEGEIGGAALDVTDPEPLPSDHPLWDLDEVIITPHNAGATPRYYERLADIVADNVERLDSGEPLRNLVSVGDD